MGKSITAVIKLLRWFWGGAEIAAAWVGGWPILWGLIVSALTGAWAFLLEWGPLAFIVAMAAAAMAMILTEIIRETLSKTRAASREHISRAKRLHDLTVQGMDVLEELSQRQVTSLRRSGAENRASQWTGAVLRELEGLAFDEFYGFKTMDMAGKVQKLRLITMRYSKKHNIRTSEVLTEARESNHGTR